MGDIQPLFAVTKKVVPDYTDLVRQLGRGFVVELAPDSRNLVQVLKRGVCVLSPLPKLHLSIGCSGITASVVEAKEAAFRGMLGMVYDLSEEAVVLGAPADMQGLMQVEATIVPSSNYKLNNLINTYLELDYTTYFQRAGFQVTHCSLLKMTNSTGFTAASDKTCDTFQKCPEDCPSCRTASTSSRATAAGTSSQVSHCLFSHSCGLATLLGLMWSLLAAGV